jgi:hypothetical protein
MSPRRDLRGRSTNARWISPVAGGTAVVATLLMVLATAGAASPAHAVTIKGPYAGTTALSSATYSNGCGTVAGAKNWNMDFKSGRATWDGSVSSTTGTACSATPGTASEQYTDASIAVTIPISSPATGSGSVELNMWVALNTSIGISATGPCPTTTTTTSNGWVTLGSCDVTASLYLNGAIGVYDATTGGWQLETSNNSPPLTLSVENYSSVDYGCDYSTTGCWSANYTYATVNGFSYNSMGFYANPYWVNGTFTHSNSYELYVWATGADYTDAWGWTSASATSTINFAHGNGAAFRSIIVS